jgi:hypothetical protein
MIMAIMPNKVIPPPIPIIAESIDVKKAAKISIKDSIMEFS